jgi:uncharacterized protein YbcC (UPF0753/DUF2309 family)
MAATAAYVAESATRAAGEHHVDSPSNRESALRAACNRIAPLWPLQDFVAVNPFHGLADQPFAVAAATLRRVAGADLLMPRDYYATAIAAGRITSADLAAAIQRRGSGMHGIATPVDVQVALQEPRPAAPGPGALVSRVVDQVTGRDWSRWVVDAISRWTGAYHDQDQALWSLPWRDLPLYQAWRQAALISRAAEYEGIRGFRRYVASLPDDPAACVEQVLVELGVPAGGTEAYLHGALVSIGGWAAYQRYLGWSRELAGEASDTVLQILAMRLAYEGGMYAACPDARVRADWQATVAGLAAAPVVPELEVDLVLLTAAEIAWQRSLAGRIVARNTNAPTPGRARKAVQAAFCIDVRSEVFRRALETVTPRVETLGFAGFFGYPIEFIPLGHEHGVAQCPVLLTPKFVIPETVAGASPSELAGVTDRRRLRRQVAAAVQAFKTSAVACFAFVEAAGLLYAAKLVGSALGIARPVAAPRVDGLGAADAARLAPAIDPRRIGSVAAGLTAQQRLDTAAAVLQGMSLTDNFARLVLLCGHGSTTVNNAHAAGLDCGACGGHTGESNARVAAAVLNDPGVRAGLAVRGIELPWDTWFVAGLHDTVTDDVTLYDTDALPDSHAADLAQLQSWLAGAGHLARTERAMLLGADGAPDVDAAVRARSRDWSEVRPEWALAGNAAFIAAPRARTAGLDLGGRSFLHSYDWRQDDGFGVLELIMTAPMVVATWINLQYYGSVVNNTLWGSGNKVLHNVVGHLGVFEGNGGDLRSGLPWQSVHDGERFVHEPLRLSVFIEAPEAELNRVLEKHPQVRQLLDNEWLHLFAIADEGRSIRRYAGELAWEPWAAAADGAVDASRPGATVH